MSIEKWFVWTLKGILQSVQYYCWSVGVCIISVNILSVIRCGRIVREYLSS